MGKIVRTLVIVMDWMFLFPQNLYFEILSPNVIVLEGGAFGRWLGHDSGIFMKGIDASIRSGMRELLS